MEREIIEYLRKIYHFLKRTPRVINTPETIILKDEYIEWLTFANAGMLHKGNLYCIDFVAKHIKSNNPIVEIGSFCGLSTNIISYYFNKYNKRNKIITSDKWEFEGKSKGMLGESCITHDHYKEFVKNSFIRNVQFFSNFNLPYAIETFSDEFFELWENYSEAKDIFERNITL